MATRFEDLINGMFNVGVGAAVTAAQTSRGLVADLAAKGAKTRDDLAAKGAAARQDPSSPDPLRSASDAFAAAGGVISDVTERLSATGATTGEKILDELIRARVRDLTPTERTRFINHVVEVVDNADAGVKPVEADSVEPVGGHAPAGSADAGTAGDRADEGDQAADNQQADR